MFFRSGPSRKQTQSSPSMSQMQRIALFVGAILFGVMGFLAVFKTENEAATAVALILAGVLLLVGVQGTPLLKFSAGDNSIELERTRQVMAEKAHDEADENPVTAEAIIAAYEAADPEASRDPSFAAAKAHIYELQVKLALQRVSRELSLPQEHVRRYLVDLALRDGDQLLVCDIRYVMPPHGNEVLRAGKIPHQIWHNIQTLTEQDAQQVGAVLLVTNRHSFAVVIDSALRSLPIPVRVQVWAPEDGDDPLKEALQYSREAMKGR